MMKLNEKESAVFELKKNRKNLTKQQFKTINGQIKSGDVAGALKGLKKLVG